MPKMNIVRKQQINAPIAKVYDDLLNMGNWHKWSPWLIMDPDTKVTIADDAASYDWDGSRVGSGNMKVSDYVPQQEINYELNFLKPWKSEAKVKFEMSEKEGGTEVTWHMDSSLPWFMFWMKKQMEAFVGNDYERGLRLLKDHLEDGEIHSKLEWLGETQYPGCKYIGFKRTCSIAEMPKFMGKDFTTLMTYGHQSDDARPEQAFSQYTKFDFVKKQVTYIAGLPVTELPSDMPEGCMIGSIPPTKLYQVKHTGPYEHIGNAWTTLATMQRNKEIKVIKNIAPFETYGNSPKNTEPNDLITYINFAVK